MKKHITYIILALLLAIYLAPATVMAEGEGTGGTGAGTDPNTGIVEKPTESEVTKIAATIKPILGAKVGAYGTNIADTHVKSYNSTPETNVNLILYGTRWFKITDADYEIYKNDIKTAKSEKKLNEVTYGEEVFLDDYHYYVVVEFIDKYIFVENGVEDYTCLPFAENVAGTINGNTATVTRSEEFKNKVISLEGYVDVKGIYDIDMTITAPALGAKADYEPDFTVTDDVCDKNSGLGVITVDTKWYKVKEDDYKGFEDSAWEIMEKDEEYTTGYYYEVDLCIYVTNNKEYNWLHRKLSKHLTGSLNGEDFDYVGIMEGEESATLSKIFNPLVEPTPTPIPTTTPVDDYTPPETGVYGPEDNSQNNNFVWTLLLVSGGAIAVSVLANKKKKYNR